MPRIYGRHYFKFIFMDLCERDILAMVECNRLYLYHYRRIFSLLFKAIFTGTSRGHLECKWLYKTNVKFFTIRKILFTYFLDYRFNFIFIFYRSIISQLLFWHGPLKISDKNISTSSLLRLPGNDSGAILSKLWHPPE